MRIGLAGLGTVGATVAARLLQGAVPRAELVAVSARDAKKDRGVDLSTLILLPHRWIWSVMTRSMSSSS